MNPDHTATLRKVRDNIRGSIKLLEQEEQRLTRVIEQIECGQQDQIELPLDRPINLQPKRAYRAWSKQELAIIRQHYPDGGAPACIEAGLDRQPANIQSMASSIKVRRNLPLPKAQASEPQPPEGDSPAVDHRAAWQRIVAEVEQARSKRAAPTPQPAASPPRPSKPRLTFEEQLALVESGRARITEVVRIMKPGPDFTLGGITAYDC